MPYKDRPKPDRPVTRGAWNETVSCRCGHAGMWHKPECRIRGCDCETFDRDTVDRSSLAQALWPQACIPGGRRA